jgi:hypothetical protein
MRAVRIAFFSAFGACAVFASFAAAGCGGGGNAATPLARAPELPQELGTRCRIAKNQDEPLVVEWPDAARGKLESLAKGGIVAVRYRGCELKVLGQCSIKSRGYRYSPVTRKESRVTIRNADELYASLPVGPVRLEAKLETAGQLNVAMILVGRFEQAQRGRVTRDEMEGDCADATHVVSALTVGAFTFYAGAAADVGGGATAFGAGAAGRSAANRELLARDGDEAACARSASSDTTPPDGCGALVQIEVLPISETRRAAPSCPPGTDYNGFECVAHAKHPATLCKEGEHYEDGTCVAESPPTPSPAPATTAAPEHAEAPSPSSSASASTTAAAANEEPGQRNALDTVVGFTSLAGFATFAVAGITAFKIASDAKSTYCKDSSGGYSYCDPHVFDDQSKARTWGWASTIGLGVGVAAGVLYFVLPAFRSHASAPAVGAAPTPGGGTVFLGGRF